MNDFQKYRFSKQIIETLFNTVNGKKIALLGWAFKKDTNDTRESPSIYIASDLLHEQAEIHVYDPKVTKEQIFKDIEYLLNENSETENQKSLILSRITVHSDPYNAMKQAHGIAVTTEWD